MNAQKRANALTLALAALLAVAACSTSEDTGGPATPVGNVDKYMADLPDWDTLSPLGAEEPPTATGAPTDADSETVDVEAINEDGSTTVLPDVNYVCRVNADATDDLVWNNIAGTTNRLYVGLGSAGGDLTFLPHQDHAGQGWGDYDGLAADINGDGRLDLLWNATTTTRNGIYAATANTDGTFSYRAYVERSNNGWQDYKAATGDISGDGRADLVWLNDTLTNFAVHMSYATASSFAPGRWSAASPTTAARSTCTCSTWTGTAWTIWS